MRYFIGDRNKNQRWAVGDADGPGNDLNKICDYLLNSTIKPEMFYIIFFDDKRIYETVNLTDYCKKEGIVKWRKW